MPGYIRGKGGVVVGESPAYPFPDAHMVSYPVIVRLLLPEGLSGSSQEFIGLSRSSAL